ncbi:MAG: hypothetical protein NUW22_05660 [Acidobacteria bacterium]|nr:hypothetical protein [Acidobacteriota bacterium]
MLMAVLLMPQQGAQGGVVGGLSRSIGPRDMTLELTLAAPVELPDGRLLGASVRILPGATADGDPWFVYSRGNLCESAITRGGAPADATDGWRISIVERSRSATHLTVAVTWLRMWERGRLVAAGSGGTSELTLQGGDRIPLDQITRPATPGACAATQKTLELRVALRVEGMSSPTSVAIGAEPPAPLDDPVTAELWLVHQSPGGAETVEHQTVRLAPGGVGFMFRGLPVGSADGPMLIDVTGQLRAVLRPDGSRALWVGLARSVTHQATGRLRFSGSTGGKTVDWLAPGDVVSFDLPEPAVFARQAAAGGLVMRGTGAGRGGGGVATATRQRGPNLLEGHRLSLRVRLIQGK